MRGSVFYPVLIALLTLLPFLTYAATPQPALEQHAYRIRTERGLVPLLLEVADEKDELETGLMFRESIPSTKEHLGGMLFDFGDEHFRTMWMKNTLIQLDMLFVDTGGIIHCVHQNAIPQDLTPIGCGHPVRYVIELPGGMAQRYGILSGDRLERE